MEHVLGCQTQPSVELF